jgi:hypothetical protein
LGDMTDIQFIRKQGYSPNDRLHVQRPDICQMPFFMECLHGIDSPLYVVYFGTVLKYERRML